MKSVSLVFAVLFCIAATAVMHAEVIPGRWEKVEVLNEGTPILLQLDGAEKIRARFLSLEEEAILVEAEDGAERKIPRFQVRKISSMERVINDSVVDGLAWGAAIGGAVGLPSLIWSLTEGDDREIGAGAFAVATGIGAGTGLAIDAATKSREVYYVARSG